MSSVTYHWVNISLFILLTLLSLPFSWVNFISIKWSHWKLPVSNLCFSFIHFLFLNRLFCKLPVVPRPSPPSSHLVFRTGLRTAFARRMNIDPDLFFTWLLCLSLAWRPRCWQDGFGDSRDPFSIRWRWRWLCHSVNVNESNCLFCYLFRRSREVKIKHRDHWARQT